MKQSIALVALPCVLAQHTEGSILDEPWSIVSLAFLSMLLLILAVRGCRQLVALDCRREQEVVVEVSSSEGESGLRI